MCDILRRLASNALTKQQYLSSLNEFSRLCRAKRKEELFQVDQDAVDGWQINNPIFRLNKFAENDVFTMDDVFCW